MNFELTEEQKDIRSAARIFAEKEFTDEIVEEWRKGKYPWELAKKACQLGFPNIEFPRRYGGGGYTFFEKVLITEEFTRVSPMGVAIAETCGVGAPLLTHFGNEAQKQRYLIPIMEGEASMSAGITEPEHGTDIRMLETTAKREGDEYVINGTKVFTSWADIATSILVLCQTNPKADPSYRGQTQFIVDKGVEGIEIIGLGSMMGPPFGTITHQINFDNVLLPKESILGELNRGFHQTLVLFNQIRILGGIRTYGMAKGAYEAALNYAKNRKTFGKSLSEFQGLRWKLAKMATQLELARNLVYKAAWFCGKGKADPVLSSMVKYWVPLTMLEVIDESIQIHGGYGYMTEYGIEDRWRSARAFRFAGGTTEMNLRTIARFLIDKGHKMP